MLDFLIALFYTIIHLAQVNWINFTLISLLLLYLCYQLFKRCKKPLRKIWNHRKQYIRAVRSGLENLRSFSWEKALKSLRGGARTNFQRWLLVVPSFLLLSVGNILFRLVYQLPFIKRERKRFNKELKPILYFKNYRSMVFMGLSFSLVAFMMTCYLVTFLRAGLHYIYLIISQKSFSVSFQMDSLLFQNLFNIRVFSIAPILAMPIFLLGLILAWKSAWVNFEQYRDYNNNEEGDDRFATVKEIRQQYKKIPNKQETYPGNGGIPVLHETKKNLVGMSLRTQMIWQNRTFSRYLTNAQKVLGMQGSPSGFYYIEDATTNLLGVGITRSGKGEGHIAATIDLNSRAEIQPSMIIGDPKGEHYQSSYKTMRKRGYDVNVLSFQNMDWSMSYNPLALAIESAKKGYYEKTQTRVNAVAEAIWPKQPGGEKGNSEYFRKSSISLFNAITIALMDRANETAKNGEVDAWDTVTARNVAKYLADLGSEEVFVNDAGEIVENPEQGMQVKRKSKLTVYFDNLRKINQEKFSKFREMADIEFRSSDFGGEETKGNIYSSMMTGLNLFLKDDIAKLTSKNSIDLESVGFPRRLSIKFRSSSALNLVNDYTHKTAKITISSVKHGIEKVYVQEATSLIDSEGYLTYAIEPKLQDQFMVKVDFAHEANEGSSVFGHFYAFSAEKVYQCRKNTKIPKRDKYSKKPILDYIQTKIVEQPENSLLQVEDIEFVYSDKPKVIFLVTPPNRTEFNSLISLFLDQLFNVNYELALSNGRKCINRILHILDEFTNLPAIPSMDTKISIGLGQNILYYLWIQNLEQLDHVYGKSIATTIRENCSVKIYIKSTSGDTNKVFSHDLGTRTITSRSRSSNIIDEANPNVSVKSQKQELLTPTQLAKLQEGEAVILRGVKGRDLSGRKITTDPIFLHDKTSLPYRYMFLQEEFDHSMTLADIPVESAHRDLNLQDIAVDAQRNLNNIIDWRWRLSSKIGRTGEEPRLSPRYKTVANSQKVFQNAGQLYEGLAQEIFEEEGDWSSDGIFVDDVI